MKRGETTAAAKGVAVLCGLAGLACVLGTGSAALGDTRFSISIGGGSRCATPFGYSTYGYSGYGGYNSCGPQYVVPAPIYCPPPVAYCPPRPVYVAPAPAYCPPPVVYVQPRRHDRRRVDRCDTPGYGYSGYGSGITFNFSDRDRDDRRDRNDRGDRPWYGARADDGPARGTVQWQAREDARVPQPGRIEWSASAAPGIGRGVERAGDAGVAGRGSRAVMEDLSRNAAAVAQSVAQPVARIMPAASVQPAQPALVLSAPAELPQKAAAPAANKPAPLAAKPTRYVAAR